MKWSRNGAELRGNDAGSERVNGSSDWSVASYEKKVSRVNERLSRLPMSEQENVDWLTSLLDGLSIPTSSVGTSAELKVTSELKDMKFRECSSDERDCSKRVC